MLTSFAGNTNFPDRLHTALLLLDRSEQLLKLPDRRASPGDATNPTDPATITLTNVSYLYKKNSDSRDILVNNASLTAGVRNVSLRLSPGFFAIVGPIGAGKSTLTKLIEGALPLQYGTIRTESEGPLAANGLLRIPQECGAFLPGTVRELVVRGSQIPFTDAQVRESLISAGLAQYAYQLDKPIARHKSGGEAQRWRIARALLLSPYVNGLIIDEGFASIDPPQSARDSASTP